MELQPLLTATADSAGLVIELLALGWLMVGIVVTFVAAGIAVLRGAPAYHPLRRRLARVTLLGLELLIVADIIETIAARPTFENLGALALIVLIRTFLSFALEVEIDGRWPWARTANDEPPQSADPGD